MNCNKNSFADGTSLTINELNIKLNLNNINIKSEQNTMDKYTKKTQKELKELCKEQKIKGYSNKNKEELIKLLQNESSVSTIVMPPAEYSPTTNVISLFSGTGGMDVGFSEQVIVHSESILSSEFIDSAYTINGFVNLKRLPFCLLVNDI